jgi:clumping factor B
LSGNAGSIAQTDGLGQPTAQTSLDTAENDTAEQTEPEDEALTDGVADLKPKANAQALETAQTASKREDPQDDLDEQEEDNEDEAESDTDTGETDTDTAEERGANTAVKDSGQSSGIDLSGLAALAAKRVPGRGVKPKPKPKSKPSDTQQPAAADASAMPKTASVSGSVPTETGNTAAKLPPTSAKRDTRESGSSDELASEASAKQMQANDGRSTDKAELANAEPTEVSGQDAQAQPAQSEPPNNMQNSLGPDSAFSSSTEPLSETAPASQSQTATGPDSAFWSSTEPPSDSATSSDAASQLEEMTPSDSASDKAPPTDQRGAQSLPEDEINGEAAADSAPADLSLPASNPKGMKNNP